VCACVRVCSRARACVGVGWCTCVWGCVCVCGCVGVCVCVCVWVGVCVCVCVRHTPQHHTTPHHATPRHTTPRHATSRHATPCHATPHHTTPCHATPRHATTRHDTTRHDTTRHATPRHATPRHATPRHTLPQLQPTLRSMVSTAGSTKQCTRCRTPTPKQGPLLCGTCSPRKGTTKLAPPPSTKPEDDSSVAKNLLTPDAISAKFAEWSQSRFNPDNEALLKTARTARDVFDYAKWIKEHTKHDMFTPQVSAHKCHTSIIKPCVCCDIGNG
jgi:hypothetical protein